MTMGLTSMQARTLDLIRAYIASEGVAPSLADLQTGLGLSSKSGVSRLIDALQERGHIRRLHHRARSIQVVDGGEGLESLPSDRLRVLRRRIDEILKGRAQ